MAKAKFKLPPDPENMNDKRAYFALEAIRAFQAVTGTDDGDAIGDLIADLNHLCDRQPKKFGKFDAQLDRGLHHYQEETSDDYLGE